MGQPISKMRLMEKKQYNDARFSYEYILQELLSLYLQDFPSDTCIKLIGVSDETKFVSMKNGGKIEFVSLPFLHLEEYEQLILSCDLFITDNITSCSMGKAVFGKIPVISLVNHMEYEELKTQRDSHNPTLRSIIEKWNYIIPNGLYPFLVFPNGWHKELAPLMEQNDYFKCVHTCEMFDLKETSQTIFNMLYSKTEIDKLQKMQQLYINNVCNLPTIKDVIKRELGRLIMSNQINVQEETNEAYDAVRNGIGVIDLSATGRIVVKGEDHVEFLDRLVTKDIIFMEEETILFTLLLQEDGTVIDIINLFKMRILLQLLRHRIKRNGTSLVAKPKPSGVEIIDISQTHSQLGFEGPYAWKLAQKF